MSSPLIGSPLVEPAVIEVEDYDSDTELLIEDVEVAIENAYSSDTESMSSDSVAAPELIDLASDSDATTDLVSPSSVPRPAQVLVEEDEETEDESSSRPQTPPPAGDSPPPQTPELISPAQNSTNVGSSGDTPAVAGSSAVSPRTPVRPARLSPLRLPAGSPRTSAVPTAVSPRQSAALRRPLLPFHQRQTPLESLSSILNTDLPPVPPTAAAGIAASVTSASVTSGGTSQQPAVASIARLNTSVGEFSSPKRRRISSPLKVCSRAADEGDEEAECCSICFESWTNSGKHRLSSLKCGHLFGLSCIERWLKGQGGKCPQCNAKAHKRDIRMIYAKAVRTLDTSERDRAVADLEKERELRTKAELEAAQLRLSLQLAAAECSRLKEQLSQQQMFMEANRCPLPSGSSASGTSGPLTGSSDWAGQYIFDRIIKIFDGGNCRVMAYSNALATLVVSQPSASQLFPGFGIKKISALDFKSSQYIHLHSKMIRDISFNNHQGDGLLLSASMDKAIKMTSLVGNATVNTHHCTMPIWSCVWNGDDKNYYFAGLQNGTVAVFDIRNTAESVTQLNTEGSHSPVVSLQYIPANPNAAFRPGGLLVSQLDRATFFEARVGGEYKPHAFPLDGNVTYSCFEESTRHLLTSYRPSGGYPHVRHQVSSLSHEGVPDSEHSVCRCDPVQTFRGGSSQKMLTRSRLIVPSTDNKQMLVCAADEVSMNLQTWDVSSGQIRQRLPCQAVVLDICPIFINNHHYLAALSDKSVRLFRWQEGS